MKHSAWKNTSQESWKVFQFTSFIWETVLFPVMSSDTTFQHSFQVSYSGFRGIFCCVRVSFFKRMHLFPELAICRAFPWDSSWNYLHFFQFIRNLVFPSVQNAWTTADTSDSKLLEDFDVANNMWVVPLVRGCAGESNLRNIAALHFPCKVFCPHPFECTV